MPTTGYERWKDLQLNFDAREMLEDDEKNLKNIFIILLIFIIPNKSFGLIEVDITRGNLNPLPIAISSLFQMIYLKINF